MASLLLALVLATGLLLSAGPFASAATRGQTIGFSFDPFNGSMEASFEFARMQK